MKDHQYDIKLTKNATPFAINVPRQVPITLRQNTEQELQRMEQHGVKSRIDEANPVVYPDGGHSQK